MRRQDHPKIVSSQRGEEYVEMMTVNDGGEGGTLMMSLLKCWCYVKKTGEMCYMGKLLQTLQLL